ncbi:MAG: glycosyltransferase family 9 protein, partial [Armatimonadetes bacterium]|nr:glycosyltransferase family 9 protein [Armatimonadota bacterium]
MGQSSVIELGEAPERIAVIKMSALGDVAKSVPTVRAIRQAYPTCSLAWIVRPAWADLLIGNPDIDRLIVVRRSLRGLVDAMREVRRFGPDLVLDMQGLLTSGLLAFASGARHRYTWVSGRELSGLLTGNPVVPGPTSLNVAECNFGFARLLGITDMPVAPPTYLTDGNPSRGQAQLMLNEAPRPIVGIHLGGSEPNKRWPAARWAEVVSGLRRMGVGVALLGGPGDRQIAEDVAARTDGGAL